MTCPDCASERESRLRAERERDEARAHARDTAQEADRLIRQEREICEQRVAGLVDVLDFARRLPMAKKNRDRIRAALSSPAVTAEGKKLGEGRGEHRPECASLEYVAETNGVTALDCNCGFAAGVPWLDSDRVLAHELLEALDDEPNHEVEVVISYLARARAAPPKTSEGA